MSLVTALGPFGELIVLLVAGLVAYFSRRQVLQTRSELGKAKVEAEAYKTAVLSIRPISELAQLSIPPLPIVRTGFSPDLPTPGARARSSSSSAALERPTEAREESDRPPDEL